jgi:DNA-binding response OmpR family regulator
MMSVKTILLVENDQVSQTMYQKRLEREGYHLECAPDGQAALDILSERAPDLVLLDLMLPKVSGADVLKFMQADPRLTTVPVIIFSNAPLTEVPPDSPLAQGTKRLLKSDCTFPKLLETIQESLATTPELVVMEANKLPPVKAVAANNGKGPIKDDHQDIIPPPDFGREIPKPVADFLAEAPTALPKLREHSMGYIKAPATQTGQTHFSGLCERVHLLHTSATQAGCSRVALLMSAFDALLSSIKDKPTTVTPSMLQTIAQAVDCLDGLLKAKDGYSDGPAIHAKVLVVDDDAVCNQVNVTSLKRANFETDGVKDPTEALNLLEAHQYDLVVLDVNMPGMTGFDICEKMRRLPHNKKTPVIFVTAFSTFDNRKQSVLSGGNDFVSKPVSPAELALKVAINLIKMRVQGTGGTQAASGTALNGSSPSPRAAAKTKNDRQISTEISPPEPPSHPTPVPDSGIRNTRMAGSLSETPSEPKPDPATPSKPTAPAKPGPAGKRDKNETPGADIHERLRQSTAELDSATANLEQESAERIRIESQWREQLSAAKALIGQTESVLKEREAQNAQLEKELAGLRKSKDELQEKLAAGEQATAKSQQETKELQERVRQNTAELQQAKTALEQQSAQQARSESEFRDQLTKVKAATGMAEGLLKERDARCGQLEKELAGLQQAREELQNKFNAGQQTAGKLQQEVNELQERARQTTAELQQAKTALEQQSAQQARSESEFQNQLNKAKAAAGMAEALLKEKDTRCGQLEKELAGLQQAREELQNKFNAGQQAAGKLQQEVKELQTSLGQQAADKMRLESEWSEKLNTANRTIGQVETALKEKEAQHAQLEKELTGLRQLRDEWQNKFAAEQQATAKARQEIKDLDGRLQQSVAELHSLREGQTAREADLRDKQKKLADGLRENLQMLQSKLQEAEAIGAGFTGAHPGKSSAR